MKIDGRILADEILTRLASEVTNLKKHGITPQLAVVLVGNNPNSLTYIRQKRKSAQKVGILFSLHHYAEIPLQVTVVEKVKQLAADPAVTALIVQRPVPEPLSSQVLTELVPLNKDVDGFLSNSPFLPPVGLAVVKLLNEIYWTHVTSVLKPNSDFSPELISWLNSKNIVILGRGETAGNPIAHTLAKNGINFTIAHTQTLNSQELISKADIIVSAVGKADVVGADSIKSGSVVIGIGLHFENGKLTGDFNETEIDKVAGFYSPTPGGSGPLNVASLMENVVRVAAAQS